MVNFKLGNEMWRWINQHDTSMGQRQILSPRQESNPWPPEHRAGALSTELRETQSFSLSHARVLLINSSSHFITELKNSPSLWTYHRYYIVLYCYLYRNFIILVSLSFTVIKLKVWFQTFYAMCTSTSISISTIESSRDINISTSRNIRRTNPPICLVEFSLVMRST